ncbi:uncharacterized protein LOC142227602 [Haematobia irritans]|uniref:uncharacterized protein LOC142227602 n=1 Tax=Haematobia irritans TaxID=7368 RepID=UPI003F501746
MNYQENNTPLSTSSPDFHGFDNEPRNMQVHATSSDDVFVRGTTTTACSVPSTLFTPASLAANHFSPYTHYVTFPQYNTPSVTQPIQMYQQQHFVTNSVKDIVSILPSFDPADKSITSCKFIQRIEQLRRSYGWDDGVLLFAVQTKLHGMAKLWIDSSVEIFSSWDQFVEVFLTEFPSIINVAEIHMKLMNMRRAYGETPENFYYRMLSVARTGGLDDQSIIKYVINGVNDNDLKRVLSVMNFPTCSELLRTILNYSSYNESYNPKSKSVNRKMSDKVDVGDLTISATKSKQEIACYNCRKPGHISRECPEPQKRLRCEICSRTGHSTSECRNNDTKYSGSARSLVRRSIAADLGNSEKCYVRLVGFGGGQYECTERIAAEVKIDVTLEGSLLIVEDEKLGCDILVGRDFLCSDNTCVVFNGRNCYVQEKNINNINETLSGETVENLDKVIKRFEGRFASEAKDIGRCNLVKMSIRLSTDEPICMKPYRLPFARRSIVREIINDMINAGIIRPSTSPFSSPIVLNEKKNGEFRMCVDYRRLNKVTIRQPFPMPIIEDIMAQLAGSKYFTTLDMKMGYHQIEVEESSKALTAFITQEGHYEFNRMPSV